MKVFVIIIVLILMVLFLRVSIYIKYDEKFEIWLNLVKIFNSRINLTNLIKKRVKLDNIKINLNGLKNDLVVSNYLVKNLLKRITISNLTLLEYSNVLSERFIIGIPFSMYYINIILKDNLEKHFKAVKNSYYSLNLTTMGFNYIKVETELEIKIIDLLLYFIKNIRLLMRRKTNDRT